MHIVYVLLLCFFYASLNIIEYRDHFITNKWELLIMMGEIIDRINILKALAIRQHDYRKNEFSQKAPYNHYGKEKYYPSKI